jgi:hypothetical protein
MFAQLKLFLKSRKGQIALVLSSTPLWKSIYQAIDAWGNLQMITDWLPSIWHFFTSTAGTFVVMASGFLVGGLQLSRQHKQIQGKAQNLVSENNAVRRPQPVAQGPEQRLLIVTPINGEEVGLRALVRGFISPPNTSLQVLIHSGDGLWYRQRRAEVDGYLWSVECQFGNERTQSGGAFKIAAMYGAELTDETYRALPTYDSNIIEVRRRSEEPTCADEWLHNIAELQRTNISAFVSIVECTLEGERLSSPVPYVEFGFQVHNGSVFWIDVEDALEGFVEFSHPQLDRDHRLGGQVLMRNNLAKGCLPGNTVRFVIEQRLSKEEASMITESMGIETAQFKFDRLFVTIAGADASKRVEAKPLPIRWGMTTRSIPFALLR